MTMVQMKGNPRARKAMAANEVNMKATNAVGHLENLRITGMMAMVAVCVFALALCMAVVNVVRDPFQSMAASIDSFMGDVLGAAHESTPASQWRAGDVPYLYQQDAQWAKAPYAGGNVAENGCGPTCMSMIYTCLTGSKSMTPDAMAVFSEQNGFVDQGMTSWTFMTDGAKMLGLRSCELGADAQMVKKELLAGHPIICSMKPGDFTTTGHFIVLCGVNDDGTIEVRDPNSPERSGKGWSVEKLLAQCANLWSFSR